MATATKTLRLRARLRAEIDRIARRTRRSFSEVTQDLLEEALRMRECPGICFANEPAGRVAKVSGTGLGVWEFILLYTEAGKNERALRRAFPQLTPVQIKAAVLYYEKYRTEIDEAIADNAALTPDAVRSRFPGLVRRA